MPALVELQQGLSRAIMGGAVPAIPSVGTLSLEEALQVHRNTVLGALVNALRISHPTVDALVGESFFDQAGCIFAEMNPPQTASLASYGNGFSGFLADFAPAASLPYLSDVARLDWAIDQVMRLPVRSVRFAIDPRTSIDLPGSLGVFAFRYPADEIRAALDDDDALAAINLTPAERFVLVWRNGKQAAVRNIGAVAGRFLQVLLASGDTGAALSAAMIATAPRDALQAIQSEVFAASFCTVQSISKEQ